MNFVKRNLRLVYAMLEHALFAATMLLLNIFLFNHLDTDQYGVFVQYISVAQLIQSIFISYTLEPVLVGGEELQKTQHFRRLWTLWLTPYVGLCAIITFAQAFSEYDLVSLAFFLGYTFTSSFLYFQRKAMNAVAKQNIALIAGIVHATAIVILFVFYEKHQAITVNIVFASLTISQVITLIAVFKIWPTPINKQQIADLYRKHNKVGKWMVASAILQWLPNHFIFLSLPILYSLQSASETKALLNLTMPLMHFNMVMAMYLPPKRRLAATTKSPFNYRNYVILSLLVHALYSATILLFADQIIEAIYSKPLPSSLPTLALMLSIPAMTGALAFITTEIRGLHLHKILFSGYLVMTPICLPAAAMFIMHFGVGGAIASVSLMYATLIASYAILLKVYLRPTSKQPLKESNEI